MAQAANSIYQITIEDVMTELLLRRFHDRYVKHTELCTFFFEHKRNICMNRANSRLNRVVAIIQTPAYDDAYGKTPNVTTETEFTTRITNAASRMTTWVNAVQIFYTGMHLASYYMEQQRYICVTLVPEKVAAAMRTSVWYTRDNGWNMFLNEQVNQNEAVNAINIHQLIRPPAGLQPMPLNRRSCEQEQRFYTIKATDLKQVTDHEIMMLHEQFVTIQKSIATKERENEVKRQQIEDCKKRRDELNKSETKLQAEVDVLDENYKAMNDQLATCEKDKMRLTEDITKANSDCESLDEKLRELKIDTSEQEELCDEPMRIHRLLKFCQGFEKFLKLGIGISDTDHSLGLSELIDKGVENGIIPQDKDTVAKKFAKFRNHLVHHNLEENGDKWRRAWTLCQSIADIPAFSTQLSQHIPS